MDPPKPRWVETFSCSFYDSVAKNCGCEIKPAEVKSLAFVFISPTQKEKDKPIKQYVNRTSTNNGVDGDGNVVEMTIGARAGANFRPVQDGDVAHVEVRFDFISLDISFEIFGIRTDLSQPGQRVIGKRRLHLHPKSEMPTNDPLSTLKWRGMPLKG